MEGRGFRNFGGYVIYLAKLRVREFFKKDIKLEFSIVFGRRSRKGFYFSSCIGEKVGFNWGDG